MLISILVLCVLILVEVLLLPGQIHKMLHQQSDFLQRQLNAIATEVANIENRVNEIKQLLEDAE